MSRLRPATLELSPISAFVAAMIDAHHRRRQATTVAEKRAIEREMEACMAQYFARTDGEEVLPADESDQVCVPRAATRRLARPGPAPKYTRDDFDPKLAAANDRNDDDR